MSQTSVFISYGHPDKVWSAEVAASLHQLGVDVWFDSNLQPGSQWLEEIEREIERRDAFALVVTPESWESPWVRREFQLAMARKKHIIPVIHKDTNLSGFMLIFQWIDARNVSATEAATLILSALQQSASQASANMDRLSIAQQPHTLFATPTSPLARPRLLVWSIADPTRHRSVVVGGESLTIGRDPINQLVLDDPAVSRQHAKLTLSGREWTIHSLTPSNALYINGQASTMSRLVAFDQIVLGHTVMRFELPSDSAMPGVAGQKAHPSLIVDSPYCDFITMLRAPSLSIGRAPESAIVVPSPIVARQQAIIQGDADHGYTITDLGAKNPVLFKNRPITSHRLEYGDTITIGTTSDPEMVMIRYAALVRSEARGV